MDRLLKTFSGGHTEPVVCIAVSDDGGRLLTGSHRGSDGVKLWRVDSAQVLKTFPIDDQDEVRAVALSANGGSFAAAATRLNKVVLWKAQTGDRVGAVESHDPSGGLGVAFPDDGQFILAAHGRRYSRFSLDLQLLREHDNLQLGRIFSPALSADGRFVASIHAQEPFELVVYDLLNDAPSLRVPPVPGRGLMAVTFTPDSKSLVAGGTQRKPTMLSAETGDANGSFAGPGHTKTITSVAVAPNGKLVLTGSEDFTAKVWNMATGAEIATLNHGGGFVNCVAFSPDSLRAFTGGNDENVKMWDLAGLV